MSLCSWSMSFSVFNATVTTPLKFGMKPFLPSHDLNQPKFIPGIFSKELVWHVARWGWARWGRQEPPTQSILSSTTVSKCPEAALIRAVINTFGVEFKIFYLKFRTRAVNNFPTTKLLQAPSTEPQKPRGRQFWTRRTDDVSCTYVLKTTSIMKWSHQ